MVKLVLVKHRYVYFFLSVVHSKVSTIQVSMCSVRYVGKFNKTLIPH